MASTNVRIEGACIRVSAPPAVTRQLRKALDAETTVEQAPLGFLVRPRSVRNRNYVLVDRCGFVLGSDRSAAQASQRVKRHLAAALPPHPGMVKLRVRSVLRHDGKAVLCLFPLLFVPAADELALRRHGHQILDQLAVDVEVETGLLVTDAAASLRAASSARDSREERQFKVAKILVPQGVTGGLAPSATTVAQLLAAAHLAGNRADILRALSRMLTDTELACVPLITDALHANLN